MDLVEGFFVSMCSFSTLTALFFAAVVFERRFSRLITFTTLGLHAHILKHPGTHIWLRHLRRLMHLRILCDSLFAHAPVFSSLSWLWWWR